MGTNSHFNIAVLDYRILPETQQEIQALAANKVTFPNERCLESERISKTGDADIVLVSPWEKIDAEYLNACPKLKYVGLCGTSTSNVEMDEVSKRGIAFSNIISGDKEPVAEFFFMELVRLLRGIGENQWRPGEEHELKGKTAGIIGLGAVGQSIANLALAYKMNTQYTSPHPKPEWEAKGVQNANLDTLLSSSEVIFICSPTNVKVLNSEDFGKIQTGSIIVQACAGTPFDQKAFTKWVAEDGNFAIFEMSAGVSNFQLYKDLPHVIMSQLVAGVTYESNQRRGRRILQNLHSFLDRN